MQEIPTPEPRVTMTISCPLSLFTWLKTSQRNVSAYVVECCQAQKKAELEISSAARQN